MTRFKITVIRMMANADLAREYCQGEPVACPKFKMGQEFFTDLERPDGFCDWAWNDIYKYVLVLRSQGNFGTAYKWMKDNHTVIACCTDGFRPVVFKIERVEG
jgi:uncharacterized repeat protein (TIGR04076 family)